MEHLHIKRWNSNFFFFHFLWECSSVSSLSVDITPSTSSHHHRMDCAIRFCCAQAFVRRSSTLKKLRLAEAIIFLSQTLIWSLPVVSHLVQDDQRPSALHLLCWDVLKNPVLTLYYTIWCRRSNGRQLMKSLDKNPFWFQLVQQMLLPDRPWVPYLSLRAARCVARHLVSLNFQNDVFHLIYPTFFLQRLFLLSIVFPVSLWSRVHHNQNERWRCQGVLVNLMTDRELRVLNLDRFDGMSLITCFLCVMETSTHCPRLFSIIRFWGPSFIVWIRKPKILLFMRWFRGCTQDFPG